MSVLDKQPCSLPTVNSLSGVLHCVVIVVVHCLDLHCSKLQTIPKNHSYIMYLHVHVYTYAVNSVSGVCHCVVICIAFGYRRTPIYMYMYIHRSKLQIAQKIALCIYNTCTYSN